MEAPIFYRCFSYIFAVANARYDTVYHAIYTRLLVCDMIKIHIHNIPQGYIAFGSTNISQ